MTLSANPLCEDLALFLAKEGYNLVLIGKEERKIEMVQGFLKKSGVENVQVRSVEYDFQSIGGGLNSLQQVENALMDIEIDVAVYVNTVGTVPAREDEEAKEHSSGLKSQELERESIRVMSQISQDVNANFFVRNLIIPMFTNRYDTLKQRSLILNLNQSRFLEDEVIQRSLYAASKAFTYSLTLSMAQELASSTASKIDILAAVEREG